MKNLVQTAIMTLILILTISLLDYRPTETAYGGGTGMKYKGNSGLIVPGGGELVAEVSFTPMQTKKQENEPPEKTQLTEENSIPNSTVSEKESVDTNEVASEEITEEHKEEHKKVDMLVISFWHGVAAVLVGGASALLVAFVWTKIRGKNDG